MEVARGKGDGDDDASPRRLKWRLAMPYLAGGWERRRDDDDAEAKIARRAAIEGLVAAVTAFLSMMGGDVGEDGISDGEATAFF